MSIFVESTKQNPDRVDSGLSGEALTGWEYCAVVRSGASTGKATVIKATTGGQRIHGVLMPMGDGTTTIASGTEVSFATAGVVEMMAGEAFNAGTELKIDTSGRAVAQSGACWVIGVAREASSGAGHLISVELLSSYAAP